MYDKSGFLAYFAEAAPNTQATYRSFLNRIDDSLGGLDAALDARGAEAVSEWAKTTDAEPFSTYRSHARSVLKKYLLYRLDKATGSPDEPDALPIDDADQALAPAIEADANFLREKEMQVQVRQQLAAIEPGLCAIDDGKEVVVATGRIDVLARDAQSRLVVIELKPGRCPPGALEQLLAYAYDVEQERGETVRAMLVAGSFTDRTRAAARRAGNTELRTYSYSLSFQADD